MHHSIVTAMRFVAIVVAGSLCNSPAGAWGKTGHRVVGEIATEYLSGESQAAIAQILGVEDLAEASTWADFMRSNDDTFWQRTAGPYHYVTVPAGKTYSEVGAPRQGDAVKALEQFAGMLRDPDSSEADRQLALRFVVHIVGDLHQPLHVGNGKDRGGNDVAVRWFGRQTRLHAVWDEDLVKHEELSYSEMTEWLLRRITPENLAAWSEPDPLVWIAESASLRDGVYPDDFEEMPDLRWDYFYQHRDTVRLRLTQGGIRLAAFLNAVFAQD